MHSHKIAEMRHTHQLPHFIKSPLHQFATRFSQYTNLIIELHIEFAAVSAFCNAITELCGATQHLTLNHIEPRCHGTAQINPCAHSVQMLVLQTRNGMENNGTQNSAKIITKCSIKLVVDRMDYDETFESSKCTLQHQSKFQSFIL